MFGRGAAGTGEREGGGEPLDQRSHARRVQEIERAREQLCGAPRRWAARDAGRGTAVDEEHLKEALHELLVDGGPLTRSLLGAHAHRPS
ncbi:hypothetical protein [Sorangium cellulosum]|uniref:hypothetical protein n=1 Tax=Sorangium cellulosum TaxID=56 RepID=UPI0012FF8C69|nr:hypothetical protein [Sorangium cellulosum]